MKAPLVSLPRKRATTPSRLLPPAATMRPSVIVATPLNASSDDELRFIVAKPEAPNDASACPAGVYRATNMSAPVLPLSTRFPEGSRATSVNRSQPLAVVWFAITQPNEPKDVSGDALL